VEVSWGLEAEDARRLNAPYLKRLATGLPYVTAKWAMTLDGKTAAAGGDSIARFYHAPGHSPDGILIQAGSLLFAGDLLLAANPVISGIAGHDRPAYLATENATRHLLETGSFTLFAPGHGPLLPAKKAARRLDRLSGLSPENDPVRFDAERRDYLLATGLVMVDELQELLTIIGGRLLVAAATLRELDEPALAGWLDREFPADKLDLAFTDFAAAAKLPSRVKTVSLYFVSPDLVRSPFACRLLRKQKARLKISKAFSARPPSRARAAMIASHVKVNPHHSPVPSRSSSLSADFIVCRSSAPFSHRTRLKG